MLKFITSHDLDFDSSNFPYHVLTDNPAICAKIVSKSCLKLSYNIWSLSTNCLFLVVISLSLNDYVNADKMRENLKN